ncbi:Ribosomal protein L28/L24 [Penicillium bovifimosum]|uniref:Large ribosomal subunit protein bL28m n=1 Tax=Penicillium bovifimosum TaxID=126998 RepID=A0A9W9H585_9EURO|nr:Ribosomal protein L28/L24 [Penicillium bovifimosum]KAJ5138798.1 Ribosomal protein L28/L24 [Penicillium bovifimosum]
MAGLHARSAMTAPFSLAVAFRSLSIATPKRSFSTTPATQSIPKLPESAPVYPYGPSKWYKQSDSGLYGGASIQFGNKISKGRNKGKTRRSWKPNVRRKKIESEALGEELFIKVTRRALRSIYKAKGLDNYLLSDRPTRLKELGPFGWNLRHQIMQSPTIKEKFAKQRKAYGVPEPPTIDQYLQMKEAEASTKIEELDIDALTKPRIKRRTTLAYGK